MPVTNHFYGGKALGAGRTIQDIGLCDLDGNYLQTTKLRQKGLVVIIFFNPDSALCGRVLQVVQSWVTDIPQNKWSAIGIAESDQATLKAWAEQHQITNITLLLDHGLYQTQNWGINRLPTLALVNGKGQVLELVTGEDSAGLSAVKEKLNGEIAKIVAAEEAAKEAARKAEEEKKAAEAAKVPAGAKA